jgi:DNA modification methylase
MDGSAVLERRSVRVSKPSVLATSGRVEAIDWNFELRGRAPAIEAIHPYPAKFIGEIPRAFIQSLAIPPGTVVLDPFCGSGTTLVEAQRAGLAAVGIDLNPIACLISRVKTQSIAVGFPEAVDEVIKVSRSLRRLPSSDIPNVNHWFKADIQHAVGALGAAIAMPAFERWQDQLRLALSSILVRVSNQESDTRYAAVTKDVNSDTVFALFSSASQKLERALLSREWELANTKVIHADTLEVRPHDISRPVGLVITSPPYPNAYEYWLYHKYRMWWLGFDPIAVREKEIGARAHFFKKNHHTAQVFVDQMSGTFELISNVLVSGGHVCFVVGRSKIHGEIVDNGTIIEKVAAKYGLVPVSRIERVINSKRKSFNLSHANIKTESILVFYKK